MIRGIFIFITDRTRVDAFSVIPKLPKRSLVIFRDYDAKDRFELGQKIRKICHARKIPFLVAGDFQLAVALNADGMHMPEYKIAEIRRAKAHKKNWIVTAAVHSKTALIKADRAGADYMILSPLFDTGNKTGIGVLKACILMGNITKYYKKTVVLGGISAKAVKRLKSTQFQGVAGVSEIVKCS